jgi:hypothetical protein
MERNYFICSVGDPTAAVVYDEENLERCLQNNCFVLIPTGKQGAIDQIKIGDILLLKYRKGVIAYGRAISTLLTDKDMSDEEGWDNRIDVNCWIKGNHVSYEGISDAQIGGTNYDTVKKVKEEFATDKIRKISAAF